MVHDGQAGPTGDLFEAAAAVAAERQGSRRGAEASVAHPQTKRAYLLRSMEACALCGRRMFGKTKKGHAYYSCKPSLNHGTDVAERFPDHPPTVWVREDALVEGIRVFFAERVLWSRASGAADSRPGRSISGSSGPGRQGEGPLCLSLDDFARRRTDLSGTWSLTTILTARY